MRRCRADWRTAGSHCLRRIRIFSFVRVTDPYYGGAGAAVAGCVGRDPASPLWKLFVGTFPDRCGSIVARRLSAGKMDPRVGETAVGVRAKDCCFGRSACLEKWIAFTAHVNTRIWKKVLQNGTERSARTISRNGHSSGENSKQRPVFAKNPRLTKRHSSMISRELHGALRKNWGKSDDSRLAAGASTDCRQRRSSCSSFRTWVFRARVFRGPVFRRGDRGGSLRGACR
jgi:hypothetical protein